MNRLSERASDRATLLAVTPIDPERHALQARIEHAKARLVEDLNQATGLLREVASRAGRGVGRMALLAGLLVTGAVIAAVVRGRRRRIRLVWK